MDSGWLSWNSSSTLSPSHLSLLMDMRSLASRSKQRAASTWLTLHFRTPFLCTVKRGAVESRRGGCIVRSGKGKHPVLQSS